MIEIKRLPEFDEWLDGIKDNMTRIRLNLDQIKFNVETGETLNLSKMAFGK